MQRNFMQHMTSGKKDLLRFLKIPMLLYIALSVLMLVNVLKHVSTALVRSMSSEKLT